MTASRKTLIMALAIAAAACGTDGDAIDRSTGPSTKESEAPTTEAPTTEARAAEPIDNFECGRLDEEEVTDIIGTVQRSGRSTGQGTINDTSYEKAGCSYFLNNDAGDYAITAVTSTDVDDIYEFLRNHAEEDEFDDNFALIDDLGDDAFVATTTGASENLDLFVKVGVTTLEISSDLEDLEPADLDQVEDNLRELAQLALDEVG